MGKGRKNSVSLRANLRGWVNSAAIEPVKGACFIHEVTIY